jgi:Ca-activated chloride channel homolog
MIGDFHFARPWWLLALVPVIALAWGIRRRQDAGRTWQGIVAPHLLRRLVHGRAERGRFSPLLMIFAGWILACIAVAGPVWRRAPAPFAEDTAALAIIVRVSPTMMTEDVQPSRLARSVEKIRDLLALRPGAKTALIAYSGSAHVVMPLTTDSGIVNMFAQALDPKIMPVDGDAAAAALRAADAALAGAGSGSILWITDSVSPAQAEALSSWRKQSRTEVRLFPPLLAGSELDAIRTDARAVDATLTPLAPDDSDVNALARAAKFASATSGELSARWEEDGYWMTPLLAALTLPFFRKGWMAQTADRA